MADAERTLAHDAIMEQPAVCHWRVDVAEMRRAVPDVFDLDLFDGEAWLGVVPFYMTNVGVRAAPALPWLSAFPELNVRTYVRVADRWSWCVAVTVDARRMDSRARPEAGQVANS
jgi:uncharacterized protein YqjF (DUF2071 family)